MQLTNIIIMKTKYIYFFFFLFSFSVLFAQKRSNIMAIEGFDNGNIVSSINCTTKNKISLSSLSYDNFMIGVFVKESIKSSSKGTSPYLVTKENVIKTTGIANVKYNLENGIIKKGDPVTSSSIDGEAMKATEPGMILGIALEDTKNSNGLVKIRIMIQYMR